MQTNQKPKHLERRRGQLEEQATRLAAENGKLRKAIETLEADLARAVPLEAKVDALADEVKSLRLALETERAKATSLAKANVALEQQLRVADAKEQALRQDIEPTRQQNERLASRASRLEREAAEAAESAKRARKVLEERDQEILRLRAELQSARDQIPPKPLIYTRPEEPAAT